MPPKSLKLDSLELDLENPRITLASDQRDAMQKIIAEQKAKLINLAESIAVRGFSPMDRCLVLRSNRAGRFIVLEGNRRVLCAKLLKNPALIHSFSMPDSFRKRLQKAAASFNSASVEPVDCFEVADREEGKGWIKQRHSGEDAGRGIVSWSAVSSSRFAGRTPALQAIDFVVEYGGLTEDQVERVSSSRFITTLDRLLSTPTVRKTIGFETNNGKLVTELPADEAIKPLKKIVLDLAEKQINVTQLKTKDEQNAYIGKLKASEKPDLSKKSGLSVSVDSFKKKDFAAKHAPTATKGKTSRSGPRTSVVPRSCRLNVTRPKIASIFEELRSLQLLKHRHAISVLLRVFLELSVDEYLGAAGIPTTFVRTGHTHEKKLAAKVQDTVNHLVATISCDAKDFLGVTKGLTDPNHPFSIDTLHAYIHNRNFSPKDTDLTTAWDNAQFLFEKIWP